jgi:pSer/pThr/pTyr-binding forkhead associated (FHA) protein
VNGDPIAALLKFAFIAVLYLFLLWIARSALKDLRRPTRQEALARGRRAASSSLRRPLLVAVTGGGLSRGASFEVDGSLTIGRSPQMDIQIDDPFASGRHARIYEREGTFFVEDIGSTNGTYLNGRRLDGRRPLEPDDSIRIGDTEFRYERQ